MNERVRNINNTKATGTCSRDTCMKTLQDQISGFYFEECSNFIERFKESRHQTVLNRQMAKFDRLWQRYRGVWPQEHAENGCSNARFDKQRETTTDTTQDPAISNGTQDLTTSNLTSTSTDTKSKEYIRRWVRNLLSAPLTEAQFSLLACGPNFTIAPRHPPMGSTSLQ